jgi:hypothetical protein
VVDPVRQLADITKIIIDTSSVLAARGSELLGVLIEHLPPGEEPTPLTVDASEDTTDDTGMTVLLAWDNSGSGKGVTIDWGTPDGVDDEAPATGTMSYQYTAEGDFTVTVTDVEDETRTASVNVTLPYPDGDGELTLTVAENTADTSRMSVDVTVDNGTNGTVTLDMGDGTAAVTNPGDGTTVSTHQFAAGGIFTVTGTDTDDATRTGTAEVTVPFTVARRRRR